MKQEKCTFIPSLLLDFSNHSRLKAPMYILTSTVHTLCVSSVDRQACKDEGVRSLYLTQQVAVSIVCREIQFFGFKVVCFGIFAPDSVQI